MSVAVIKTTGEQARRVSLSVDIATAVLVRQVARHEHKSVAQLVDDMIEKWIRQEHPEWQVLKGTKPKAKAKAKAKAKLVRRK